MIVGEGPERAAIETAARALGIGDRVQLLGERLDTAALLAGFDVFVSASVPGEETFGLAAVEALATDLPTVVTYCPAFDGWDDWRIVRSAPDVSSLGAGLASATASVINRPRRGCPPQRLEEFAIDAVVAQIDELYTRLARERGRTPRGETRPTGIV